jgi:hypothetical protein
LKFFDSDSQKNTLVKQLEETMLTVGSWLSKVDDPGLILALFTIDSHPFAVGLHVYLLDVGSEFT